MKTTFKIEIRDDCKKCGGPLPNCRFRTFCSKECRKKFYNDQDAEKMLEWQRIRRAKNKAEKEKLSTCTDIKKVYNNNRF